MEHCRPPHQRGKNPLNVCLRLGRPPLASAHDWALAVATVPQYAFADRFFDILLPACLPAGRPAYFAFGAIRQASLPICRGKYGRLPELLPRGGNALGARLCSRAFSPASIRRAFSFFFLRICGINSGIRTSILAFDKLNSKLRTQTAKNNPEPPAGSEL